MELCGLRLTLFAYHKTKAMPMKVMMFVVRPLHYFHILFYPFVWLLNASANGIVKAMGLKPAGEEAYLIGEVVEGNREVII